MYHHWRAYAGVAGKSAHPHIRTALMDMFHELRNIPGGKDSAVTNAYWSIKLPRRWRRTFVVKAGWRRWRFTRLPFGWKYSPAICQRLVEGIVARALRDTHTDWDVYLDDILITARHPWEARQGARRVVKALHDVGFMWGCGVYVGMWGLSLARIVN